MLTWAQLQKNIENMTEEQKNTQVTIMIDSWDRLYNHIAANWVAGEKPSPIKYITSNSLKYVFEKGAGSR